MHARIAHGHNKRAMRFRVAFGPGERKTTLAPNLIESPANLLITQPEVLDVSDI